MDWFSYVDHVYLLNNGNERCKEELHRVGLDIYETLTYNIDKKFVYYKHFKDADTFNVIKDAYKNGYESILIIKDEVKFDSDMKFIQNMLERTKNKVFSILNKGDIYEDIVLLRKPAIDYIANLKLTKCTTSQDISYFNDENIDNIKEKSSVFAKTNWRETLIQNILDNFNAHKVNICRHVIDYVISYVNSEDTDWLASLKKFPEQNKNSNRWADHGLLEYNVKLINTFLPWIDNIIILVSSKKQVPSWVKNYNNIRIVTHSEFIPKKFLPTFNSCTIETFLFNIPKLSEYFIYSNDDVLCINPIEKIDMFSNGKPVSNIINIGEANTTHLSICKNTFSIILSDFSLKYFKEINLDKNYKRLTHIPHPCLASTGKHIYKLYKENIEKTITTFRDSRNINQYYYTLYEYLSQNFIQKDHPTSYCELDNLIKIKTDINSTTKFICLNDSKIVYSNLTNIHNTIYNILDSKISDNAIKIDFVFPYVDSADPIWDKEYRKYCPDKSKNPNMWAVGPERFRGNDLLKYMFRSVAKNMPWINKMHMIVMCDSQVPSWVNRNTVNIIYHKDFIPSQLLPTFNSSCIEMFIQNIEKLGNYYIYSNDDIYFIDNIKESDVFINKVPIFGLTKRLISDKAPGDVMRLKSINIIRKNPLTNIVYNTQHIHTPFIKKNNISLYNRKKTEILSTCSKFREDKNVNQYMFLYNQAFNGVYINKKTLPILSTTIDKNHKYNDDYIKYKVCCLNDSNDSMEEDLLIVRNKLEELFPTPCKYEKN